MTDTTLTIRRASDADRSLAQRAGRARQRAAAHAETCCVAEVGEELWAAVEVGSGAAIADPFRPSGDLVELLRFRAHGIRGENRAERGTFARLLPRAA